MGFYSKEFRGLKGRFLKHPSTLYNCDMRALRQTKLGLVALVSACLSILTIGFSTVNAEAASVTSNNNAICNQTVGSNTGVTATRLSGGDCVVTFTTAGTPNTWTVPSGVTAIQLLVVGGGGGGGIDGGSGGGGGGAYQTSSTPVTPGASYSLYVGSGGAYGNYGVTSPGNGESSTITINGTVFAGLGGAAAANGISTNPQPAAALGGGYQGTGGTGYNGATGGAGIGWVTGIYGAGSNGNAGNLTSTISGTSTVYGGSGAGGGNTATITTVPVRTGGAGGGGNATYETNGTYYSPTNGAANTGGGGGAGLSNASTISYKSSAGGGSGVVILRFTPDTSITVSLSACCANLKYRTTSSITATTSVASKVTFYANGKRIPGCIQKSTVSLVATCDWKPSVHAQVSLSVQVFPVDTTYASSQAVTTSLIPSARSTKR